MNLEGKTVLITGANRGIGAALVTTALDPGARRVYAGTCGGLVGADPHVLPVTLDVTDSDRYAGHFPDPGHHVWEIVGNPAFLRADGQGAS